MNISPLKLEAAIVEALPDYSFSSEYPNKPSQFVGTNHVCVLSSTVVPSNPQPYRALVTIACYSGDRYTVQSTIERLVDDMQQIEPPMEGQTATSWSEVFRSGVAWDGGIQSLYQYVQFDFSIRVD